MMEQGFCAKCDRPSSMDNHAHNCLGEVCTHGSLKRQCQICELESERDGLEGRIAELEAQRFLCPDCEAPLKASMRMDGNSYWIHPVYECPKEIQKQLNQEMAENNRLRELAGRMAEVLEEVAQPPYHDSDLRSLLETLSARANAALSAFRATKGKGV